VTRHGGGWKTRDMPSYVALLRAVNVGGRVYKMADLRADLESAGLTEVETYIQTGNVRFRSTRRSVAKVEQHLEEVLTAGAGFAVSAIMLTPAQLRETYQDAMALPTPSFGSQGQQRRYVTFFKQPVPDDAAAEIGAWDADGESATAVGRAVHIWLNRPSMEAVFFTQFKQVLAPGTNRDLKVVTTLAERWGG
jgi:uncharacterized protein (DUF1697 family)